jgi:hypothetical protein
LSPGDRPVACSGVLPLALCRRTGLLAALLSCALACGVPAQAPAPGLTAEEVAARLEKAGKDPVALLELVPLVDARQAGRVRELVKALLADRKQIAAPGEPDLLTRRFARALPGAARSPAEVRELLGPPRQVLRQVLYRRYVEQWHYDTPLTLCVVLQAVKGQEARVQSVLLPGDAKP